MTPSTPMTRGEVCSTPSWVIPPTNAQIPMIVSAMFRMYTTRAAYQRPPAGWYRGLR